MKRIKKKWQLSYFHLQSQITTHKGFKQNFQNSSQAYPISRHAENDKH